MKTAGSAAGAAAPRIFLDADAVIAGMCAGSVESAAYVLLLLGEATVIDAVVSEQVVAEVSRNVARLLPDRGPEAALVLRRACRLVATPSDGAVAVAAGWAHPKDAPILAAALASGCQSLVTFNARDFRPPPDRLVVQSPGQCLRQLRARLAGWR